VACLGPLHLCEAGLRPAHHCGRPDACPAPERPRPRRAQACLAWRTDGGRVVVVLSQRDKLAMEGDFRRLLPPAARFGTRFVFRQARAAAAAPRPALRPPHRRASALHRSRSQRFRVRSRSARAPSGCSALRPCDSAARRARPLGQRRPGRRQRGVAAARHLRSHLAAGMTGTALHAASSQPASSSLLRFHRAHQSSRARLRRGRSAAVPSARGARAGLAAAAGRPAHGRRAHRRGHHRCVGLLAVRGAWLPPHSARRAALGASAELSPRARLGVPERADALG